MKNKEEILNLLNILKDSLEKREEHAHLRPNYAVSLTTPICICKTIIALVNGEKADNETVSEEPVEKHMYGVNYTCKTPFTTAYVGYMRIEAASHEDANNIAIKRLLQERATDIQIGKIQLLIENSIG